MKILYRNLIFLFCVLYSVNAQAVLSIEITQGVETALPIAIVPFGWEGETTRPPESVSGVIKADLHRSGRFSPLPDEDMLSQPREGSQINFRDWRLVGVDSIVVGRVRQTGGDNFEVRFQLFDVLRQTQLTGFTIRTTRANLRRTAHQIADMIYETLLGEPGAFATRIAYVTEHRDGDERRYALEVADSDGHNPRPVLRSEQPLMSPAWAPDGDRLAYVSFESGFPEIFIQNVNTGARDKVSSGSGLNGAPAWSPDGRKLAFVLSRDGSPSIYVLDIASRELTRVTRSFAIDTEPVWTPDGRSIIFTSDRGGRPQIYRVGLNDRQVERLTFEGSYNGRPTLSPNGEYMAMVHNSGRGFSIAVMELETGDLRILSKSGRDESPSFAPNGSMIIYSTKEGARELLSVVSVDGRVHQRLVLEGGQARDPSWSPYLR